MNLFSRWQYKKGFCWNATLSHFVLAVKRKPDICGQKSAALPSDHHQIPATLQRNSHLTTAATKALKDRGLLTAKARSQQEPEPGESLRKTLTLWRAPLPKMTGHLFPCVIVLLYSHLPTAQPPPAPLCSRRSSTMTSWWMCTDTRISCCPPLSVPPPITPTQRLYSPVTIHLQTLQLQIKPLTRQPLVYLALMLQFHHCHRHRHHHYHHYHHLQPVISKLAHQMLE